MKQWRLYLAGVLLLEQEMAVRLGRTTDVVRSIDDLQDCCPLPIAKVWSLRVLDNRAARGIESTIADALSARLERSRWFRFQLSNDADKALFGDAMTLGEELASVGNGSATVWGVAHLDVFLGPRRGINRLG